MRIVTKAEFSGKNTLLARLADDVDDAVKKTLEKEAKKTHHTLRYRGVMDQYFSRFPKSDKDKVHAYTAWKLTRVSDNEYRVHNDHTNRGYNYVKNLADGSGWGWVKNPVRLVKVGGRMFSTQMPRGMAPFLIRRRKKIREALELSVEIAMNKKAGL